MPILYHDYETYCDLDIKQVGAEAYCRHPSFEILMAAYALDGGPVQQWVPAEGEPMPADLHAYYLDPNVVLSAFNAGFEKAATREGLGYVIEVARYVCTMAKAYCLSFTGGLAQVGAQVGLPQDKQKLDIGQRLINRFCKPAPKNHKATRYTQHTHPDEWADFKRYNIQDVEAERAIDRILQQYEPLRPEDHALWVLDQEINQRGLPANLEAAEAALALHGKAKHVVKEEMRSLTGLDNPNSTQQLDGWLREKHGVVMPDFKAQTIKDTIKGGFIAPEALQVLDMKRRIGMTAPTKWKAYLARACDDRMLRGMFTFAGASRTWRWASRGVNLQNLKTPKFDDMSVAIWFILQQNLQAIQALYGDPIEFLAGAVRGGIEAPDGEMLAVSDLKSIESRVVGWVSGCKAINDTFARGLDTYIMMAMDIYGVPYDAVDTIMRKFAKPVVLAGPYGQGAKGLVGYAENFGVELSEDEARKHVNTFREKCWEIPEMWRWLEAAIFDAIQNKGVWHGYKLSIYTQGEFLFIMLPSGRRLSYHKPKLEMKKTPWGEMKLTFTYMGTDKDRPTVWTRISAHPGLVVENFTQAIARDILACGLTEAERRRIFTIGHVHDEIIARVPALYATEWLHELEESMCVLAPWMEGLILEADGFITKNYQKG